MRSLPIKLLIAFLLLPTLASAESVTILVQTSPLAGSQYHDLKQVRSKVQPGDRLTLVREENNKHDRNAVRVEWNGHPLGYVPRAENRAIAHALDNGQRLEGRISRLRETTNPWQRVEFDVYLVL